MVTLYKNYPLVTFIFPPIGKPSVFQEGFIWNAAVVPYEDTFLVVGGTTSLNGPSDRVYRYLKGLDVWEEMSHLKLSTARQGHTAMLVSSSLFPAC